MARKTKVRIVGEPNLCDKVCEAILDHFDTEDPQYFDRAVDRDYAHSEALGKTIYIVIKKPRICVDCNHFTSEHKCALSWVPGVSGCKKKEVSV